MSGDLNLSTDLSGLNRISNLMAAAGRNAPIALARAVNHTGAKAQTQMAKVLVPQTGLQYRTTKAALKASLMIAGRSDGYAIKAEGGNIRLKYFKPRETLKGVSAAPWNKRQVFAGTFMKGGRFPNRVTLNMGGHVYRRVGKARLPIEGGRSGLFIAREMVTGESKATFFAVVERDLPDRMAHELSRLIG